jgi:hypothetical protein
MRKGVGALLAAGSAILIWLFKKGLDRPVTHHRNIVLGPKQGQCGVAERPTRVRLRRRQAGREDTLIWRISNPSPAGSACDRELRVCIENWKLHGEPVDAPLVRPGGGPLCERVRPRTGPATLPARPLQSARTGIYSYEIWIDGQLARDPMVEIVP